MLTDDADNDNEYEDGILLTNQQMCSNYLQWAEQYVKYKRNIKKHNDFLCHQVVYNSFGGKNVYL